MKKTLFHTIVALLFGALSIYIFFALNGVVLVWSFKSNLHSWIYYLPKQLQSTAYLLHCNFEGFIVAIPVLGFFGVIIGIVVNKKSELFGLVAFIGAICFFFIYHIIMYDGDLIWVDSVPAWSQIFPYFTWLFIFICSSMIGNKKLKKHFIKG